MKTRFLPLALCLALTACLSVPYVPAPKQLSAASAQEALTQVQAGLAEDPNNPGLNAQAAELYLSLGQWEPARAAINLALDEEPQMAAFRLLAGKVEFQAQDYFAAISHLTSAISLDNRLLEGHYYLALSYQQTGKSAQALATLDQALALEPLYFDAHLAKAKLRFQNATSTEDFPLQAADLETALKINPRNIEGNLLLAEIYQRLGASLKARMILEDWLKNYQDNDELLFALAKLDLDAGYLEEAKQSLHKMTQPSPQAQLMQLELDQEIPAPELLAKLAALLEQYPQAVEIWVHLGRVQYEQGLYKDAERTLQKALRLDPKAAEAYFTLSFLYRAQGDDSGAKWSLGKALELEPTQLKYQLFFIENQIDQGNWQSAKDAMQSFKLDIGHPQVVFLLGRIQKAQGDYKGAAEHFDRAGRLWGDLRVEMELASLDILAEQFTSAQQRVEKVRAAAPRNLKALLLAAELHFAQNQPQKVVELLTPWAKAEGGSGRIQLYLGEALAKTGKAGEAIKVLQRGLMSWPRDPELVQAVTFHLGVAKRYLEAIPLLEDMKTAQGHTARLLRQRLLLYYHLSGKTAKADSLPYLPPRP